MKKGMMYIKGLRASSRGSSNAEQILALKNALGQEPLSIGDRMVLHYAIGRALIKMTEQSLTTTLVHGTRLLSEASANFSMVRHLFALGYRDMRWTRERRFLNRLVHMAAVQQHRSQASDEMVEETPGFWALPDQPNPSLEAYRGYPALYGAEYYAPPVTAS